MLGMLGSTVDLAGCVTRLIDVVGRSSDEIESRLGYRQGHLRTGFQVALLKAPLGRDDIVFFGYTYFSGGKIGLPSNDPVVEAGRRPLDQDAYSDAAGRAAFKNFFSMSGPNRVVKILDPEWEKGLGDADKYPRGDGVPQWNIVKGRGKPFLIAAEVKGSIWTLAGSRGSFDVSRHNYNLSYQAQPVVQVRTVLEGM